MDLHDTADDTTGKNDCRSRGAVVTYDELTPPGTLVTADDAGDLVTELAAAGYVQHAESPHLAFQTFIALAMISALRSTLPACMSSTLWLRRAQKSVSLRVARRSMWGPGTL